MFGFGLWKEIVVDLKEQTFSLKIAERKKLFIISGKLTLNVPYASDMTLESSTLKYKPKTGKHSFEQVVEAFKKMLEENE